MRKIKTLVQQDFDIIAPFVERDEGNVPPILFFHFDKLDESISKELNTTQGADTLNVENGFFVPMNRESVLENKDIFMGFMATIMATLTKSKTAGKLKGVSISVSGRAMKIDKTSGEAEKEADVFLVSGIDDKGNNFSMAKELAPRMGMDKMVYDLIDSDFISEAVDSSASLFITNFFEDYNNTMERIDRDQENLKFLAETKEEYLDEPAKFVAEMIDAATHATTLVDSMNQS